MNRALRRISIAVLVMFVLLLVNVNYLQGFDTASLASKPGNSRAFYAAQNQYQRGSIVTSDGMALHMHKDMGLVADIFTEEVLSRLGGTLAIGHTRYSTCGDSALLDAQPIR